MPKYSTPFQPRENSGSLFKNEKRSGKQPDYRGDLCIGDDVILHIVKAHKAGEDVMVQLAGWKKVSSGGKTYLSLSVSKPFVKDGEKKPREEEKEDDIPF